MGGTGSGRPNTSGRRSLDGYRFLDVHYLHRQKALEPGRSVVTSWSRGGKQIASVAILTAENQLIICDHCQVGDDPAKQISQVVQIIWKPCRYGGRRPYFICPCSRRAIRLYGAGRLFLCRRCHRLNYASQSETRFGRALRRAQAIRTNLGGSANMTTDFPDRPKGMPKP